MAFSPYETRGDRYSAGRMSRVCGPSVLFLVLLSLLAACNNIGTVASRAEDVNRTTANYAASAILLNVLRANDAEPLNFVSLAGVTGHMSAGGTVGLPTIVVGPGRTPAQNLFLFGPNSLTGSESSDFAVNVVDDPASYAALARPADPATIGFFVNQFYNRDLLMFLLISRIDVLDSKGNPYARACSDEACRWIEQNCNELYRVGRTYRLDMATVMEPWRSQIMLLPESQYNFDAAKLQKICEDNSETFGEYFNEPFLYLTDQQRLAMDGGFVTGFFSRLLGYINSGLTVGVDESYVPQAGTSAVAQFCFDPYRVDNDPSAGSGVGNVCKPETTPVSAKPTQECQICVVPPLPPPQVPQTSSARPGTGAVAPNPAAPDHAQSAQSHMWTFIDPDPANPGGTVHVYTRSVFGMYRYLGEVLRLQELNALGPLTYPGGVFNTDSPATQMLRLTHDSTGCWTSVIYKGRQWCVPDDANGTKRTFALLHEMFELYAKPNTQQVTPTVRVTQ
jgi:hypothetical protein